MAEQEHPWSLTCAHCENTYTSKTEAPPAGVLLSEFGRSYQYQNAVAIIEKAFFCEQCAAAHTLLELIELTYNAQRLVDETKEEAVAGLADQMISDLEQGLNDTRLVGRLRLAAARHNLSQAQINELVNHIVDTIAELVPPAEELRGYDLTQWVQSLVEAQPKIDAAFDEKLKEIVDGKA